MGGLGGLGTLGGLIWPILEKVFWWIRSHGARGLGKSPKSLKSPNRQAARRQGHAARAALDPM